MFGTFRFNKILKEAEYVELSCESGVDARGYTLIACALCLARKLKCSGERSGCSRCLASSVECVYGTEGDGHGNSRRAGRSKGATRRRQTVLLESPTADNERPSTTAPNIRTTTAVHDTPRWTGDGESRDVRRADIDEPSPPALDSTKNASARIGHHTDAPPSTDWSSELFGSNDFTRLDGESTSFGLNSTNSAVDGTVSNFGLGTTPGHAPSLSQLQPPSQSTHAPSTSSLALSIPEDALHLLSAQDPEICFPRLGTTRPGSGCQCLTTLTGILERLGRYRLGDKPKSDKNLDCLLFSLGTGVDACKKVLSCQDCNACHEHSILMATIAERLPHICNDLCGCLLVHQNQLKAAVNTGVLSESSPSSSLSGNPSGGNPQHEKEGGLTLVNGEISFARYKTEAAELRVRLIQNLMALYMTDLLAVLDQVLELIGQVDGTVGMLEEAREMAATAQWMLQQLRSGP